MIVVPRPIRRRAFGFVQRADFAKPPSGGGGSALPSGADFLYEPANLSGTDGNAATGWANGGAATSADLVAGPNGAGIYRATAGPNGGPCIDFTTGWQGMVATAAAHSYDGSDCTVFVVAKFTASKFTGTTKRHPFYIYDTNQMRLEVTSNSGAAVDMAFRSATTTAGGTNMTDGAWLTRGFVKNQTAGKVTPYIEGVQGTPATHANITVTSPSYVGIGAYLTTYAPWLGEVAWVGFWPRALTDEECGEVDAYLNSLLGV